MASSVGKIVKYKDFLKGRIDTDKILDCLLAKTILSKEEVDEVKSRPTMCKKNEKLLDIIIEKEKEEEFIAALRDANQRHLANYLINDGVRNQNVWDDWPLLTTKIQIIDVNCGSLKEMIEIGGGLLDKLIAKKVISHRHKQLICSKATDSEKNETFLDILRRGSMGDYENTILCLRDSNQDHIAEILDEGGAVMPVHAELQEPLAEIRLAETITDLLRDRPVEQSRRILNMAKHKVIAAKKGQSVIFYFYCKTSQRWRDLKKAISSGSLKVAIEQLCKRVDSATNVVIKTIHILAQDQEILDKFFAIKERRRSLFMFLPSIFLSIIAIISVVADIYARQAMPCYTEYVECHKVQTKMDVILGLHNNFTLNFKQLQNATSELQRTVKESPDNDDLVSLILKMYEEPDEQTRQKITERIRQLEKELLEKGNISARRKKRITNVVENVINLIGKVSLIITIDILQLAEDLLKLVNDTLTTIDETRELDAEEDDAEGDDAEEDDMEGPVVFLRYFIIRITYFIQFTFVPRSNPLPELPGPPETDRQEIYEKNITEKLAAVENSLQETVLVLIQFIKETEGVNHLLRRILTNFQENSEDICSETPNIKESKKRGYQELHTGMLRLTCLMGETVRMAQLVRELNTQATSLKQDVDRMVEEVNEFVKQSIPSLLITLLKVTKQETQSKLMKPR